MPTMATAILAARDVVPLAPGSNASDTVIGGLHFNKTVLDYWNYTLYSNNTLSNGSSCYLTFEPYVPAFVLPNGTFINATACWSPVNDIGPRAGVGVGFATAFGLTIVAILVNLKKHGSIHLPVEKRFFPIGRRWQWYWGLFVCAAALISLLTNIDVDRYYVPQLPIVLNVFFWYLMQMGTVACVWEAVRHWGSWMERQFIDPNPFVLPQDDRRGMFEFWLPLVFYLFLWLNFFMIVPRSWGAIELQRSPEQTLAEALPASQSVRFKVAAFFLVVCWAIIAVSLMHSIKHYCPRNRAARYLRYIPPRFVLMMPLLGCLVAYQALTTFSWANTPLNVHTDVLAMYLGGYAPSLLILWVNCVWGWTSPNEDRALRRQRRARGQEIDRELGIVRKPAWWRPNEGGGAGGERVRDRIARNVREIGGGHATAKTFAERNAAIAAATGPLGDDGAAAGGGDVVEMRTMGLPGQHAGMAPRMTVPVAGPNSRNDRRRTEQVNAAAAQLLFPGTNISVDRVRELMQDGPPPEYKPPPSYGDAARGAANRPPGAAGRSNSTGTVDSATGKPVSVKSMLDI